MPLYDYECPSCGAKFDAVRCIDDRKTASCVDCGEVARLVIGSKAPGLSIFKPGWWRDIDLDPKYIETPQQLREELDKRAATAPLLEDGVWKTSPGRDHEEFYVGRRKERRQYEKRSGQAVETAQSKDRD